MSLWLRFAVTDGFCSVVHLIEFINRHTQRERDGSQGQLAVAVLPPPSATPFHVFFPPSFQQWASSRSPTNTKKKKKPMLMLWRCSRVVQPVFWRRRHKRRQDWNRSLPCFPLFLFPVVSFCTGGNNGVLCFAHFARGRNLHGPDVLCKTLYWHLSLLCPEMPFKKTTDE